MTGALGRWVFMLLAGGRYGARRGDTYLVGYGKHTSTRVLPPWSQAAAEVSFDCMNMARIVYRYLAAVFLADVVLQFFLAGAGVFSAGPGTAARESSALDPHRANGMVVMLLALLLLIAALVARNGRWRWVLPLLVLTLLQPVLAIAGAAGGLHVLNAVAILGIGGVLTYRAWRSDRRQHPEPASESGEVSTAPRVS
jgi:Family of unknown function (DUF6220)